MVKCAGLLRSAIEWGWLGWFYLGVLYGTGVLYGLVGWAVFVVSIFLFKNKMCSTMAGFRRFLFFDKISPVLEKILSHGTEDAGVQRNWMAT